MQTTESLTTAQSLRRGDLASFVPVGRRNRISIIVDCLTTHGTRVFVHGIRCNAEGAIDSQSRRHAWLVESTTQVRVDR